jgi:hypothetical protein
VYPDRQVYLNDPDKTPAEELLTEIQIPVKINPIILLPRLPNI